MCRPVNFTLENVTYHVLKRRYEALTKGHEAGSYSSRHEIM